MGPGIVDEGAWTVVENMVVTFLGELDDNEVLEGLHRETQSDGTTCFLRGLDLDVATVPGLKIVPLRPRRQGFEPEVPLCDGLANVPDEIAV